MTCLASDNVRRLLDLYGSGVDGDVELSSGTTTIGQDASFNSLILNGSASISTNGYRLRVKGTLDLTAAPSNAIRYNGNAGVSATSGTGGTYPASQNSGSLLGAGLGLAGGNSSTTTGSSPEDGYGVSIYTPGGTTGAAGAGGNGMGGNGATGNSNPNHVIQSILIPYPYQTVRTDIAAYGVNVNSDPRQASGTAGGGGGGGGGDGATSGGGGGSGGNSGGLIQVFARIISRGTNANTAIISANGGNGGNGYSSGGNTGGGGGGSGGSGGAIVVVCEVLLGSTITDAISVDGGSGGDGGTGLNNGFGGYSGSIGQALLVANVNKVLSSIGPSTTVVSPTARIGGVGPSGRIDL